MSPSAHISEVPLVLIVDDDVSVRRSTERLIRSLGMRAERLANMRTRAKSFGAELDIQSTPGCGTSVVVRLPLPTQADQGTRTIFKPPAHYET